MEENSSDKKNPKLVKLTAEIVSAYVSNNILPVQDVSSLIADVHDSLSRAMENTEDTDDKEQKPAVAVSKSIKQDYLICLEDGKKFKSLKRHLRTQYNLTPEAYREKWSLPSDYPMVAPSYAKTRSSLAKEMGLGQKGRIK